MLEFLRQFFRRYFSDPQAIGLLWIAGVVIATIYWFGSILAPLLAALVVAYILHGPVERLERLGLPKLAAVWTIVLVTFGGAVAVSVVLVPLIMEQVVTFAGEAPRYVAEAEKLLRALPRRYPGYLNTDQTNRLMEALQARANTLGETVLDGILAGIPEILTMAVYAVTVPIMVFFLLKDARKIAQWFQQLLPTNRGLARQVWEDIDNHLDAYVRGKAFEILLVWIVSWAVFWGVGLNYAAMLAVLNGVSVVIPYVGAIIVTIPVVAVGLAQWGASVDFWTAMSAYLIVQALDANVVVPLLFGNAVNIHPLAILVAIVFFGGVGGFWGIFFAIPLAAVLHSILRHWPMPADKVAVQPPDL